MPLPTILNLENMQQDIADLATVVNTVENTDVQTRLGKVHKSLTGRMAELQTKLDTKDAEGQAALATAKDKLARYAAVNYKGDFVATTAYEANDVWKNTADGSLWIVPADYTSGATAQADIDAKSVRPHQDRDRVESVDTIADLRLVGNRYAGKKVSVGGHTVVGIGGGEFIWKVGDFTEKIISDNAGVHIAAAGTDGSTGAWVRVLKGTSVSVEMFGGLANKTDCSISVLLAVKFVISNAAMPTIGSNKILSGGVLFEGGLDGEYLINDPQSLLPNTGSNRYVGLTFFSVSQGTTIHFGYDGDDYLCYNNNQHLFLLFSNLRFTCNSDTAKFMYSTGNGGAQNIYYDKVSWAGVWQKLFVLRGANNNSEWGWQKCSITASIRDVMFDSADSDQFLNYWWNMCKIWLFDGQCIRSSAGGHYEFTSCDWSGLEPSMTLNQSTNGGHLFELLGASHSRGVCSLKISGGRFEHKNDLSKLLYCEWGQGKVEIDADCNAVLYADPALETVKFYRASAQGPSVKFTGTYQGVHRYSSGVAAFNYQAKAGYENVQTIHNQINDFIKVDSETNAGSNWVVECDDIQSKGAQTSGQIVMNATIGGMEARGSSIQKRSFKFADAQGKGTPSTTNKMTAIMPSGALITKVTWYSSGVLTSAASVDFTLRDGLGNAISNHADTLSNAWYVVDDVAHQLTDSSNSIYIEDSNGVANQQSKEVWCIIEYIFG